MTTSRSCSVKPSVLGNVQLVCPHIHGAGWLINDIAGRVAGCGVGKGEGFVFCFGDRRGGTPMLLSALPVYALWALDP